MTECTPTRILPAFTRSATRASETCCASARLANMAAKVTERRSIFICASKARGWPPPANAGSLVELRIRVTGFMERRAVDPRESLRLDTRKPHHLGPLLGFIGDQLRKIDRRAGDHGATELLQPQLDLRLGDRRIDLAVELADDFLRRGLGSADAVPRARLVPRHEFGNRRNVRQLGHLRRRRHRERAQPAALDRKSVV